MKGKKIKRLLLAAVVIVIVVVGIYFFMKYQTYDYMEITKTYENSSSDNANYKSCLDGILKYSRDGIALLTKAGKAIWNQPCQMSNPVVVMCGDSVAVGDKGGTSIFVFQKKGLKGEIKTTRPIEKLAVSSQGIVSAILKDEETPMVMCYDAVGNVLVEHKVSLNNMGYPIAVSISEDGNTLLVSYLHIKSGKIVTKVAYYYFGDSEIEKDDYQVQQKEIDGVVVPTVAFLDKDTSLLVADNALIFYEGLKKPKEYARVKMENAIQSVGYNDKLVAVIMKNDGETDYKLKINNIKGKVLATVEIENPYANIKVVDDQVILYDGQMCSIYMSNGTHRYEGKMDENITEIFPIFGLHKYMVINASGFHEVQLAK